ncbi:MAG TPA: carbohydrate kinase, partial [Candidatus Gemmiger faecavium]|nr:carbohydrate kinase [Candidatus Gemmiger faecavium]
TRAAIAYAKEHGKLISFDPNLRKPLWPSDAAAKEQIEWGLHQADIVKISDEEIEFLWGLSPEEGAQKLLAEYGVRLVYATLGPKGCHFANAQGCGEVASPSGIHVVDTTGAGDIFGGSAMSQFLKLNKAPEALTVEELRTVTRFACCAASLSTQTHGGIGSVVEESTVRSIL